MQGNPRQLIERIAADWFFKPLTGYGCFSNERERVAIEVAAARVLARLARDRGHVRVQTAAEHCAEVALVFYADKVSRRDGPQWSVPIVASQAAYDKLRPGSFYFWPISPVETDQFQLRQKT